MKTDAIQKINKMGKISNVIAVICKILLIMGLAISLVAAIVCMVLPKNSIAFATRGDATLSVDWKAFGITASEGEEAAMSAIFGDNSEDDVQVNWSFQSGMQTYVPVEMTADGDVISVYMTGEEGVITVRDLGVLLLAVSATLLMTLITCCFAAGVCKAFRDCESPFEENVTRKMQRLAISLIPWTVISSLSNSATESFLSGRASWSFTLDLGIVLVVLIVLILVYIFKYGAVLQQESDETL